MKGKRYTLLLWNFEDEEFIHQVFENEKIEDYIFIKWILK
jgi:hypothetical protein